MFKKKILINKHFLRWDFISKILFSIVNLLKKCITLVEMHEASTTFLIEFNKHQMIKLINWN